MPKTVTAADIEKCPFCGAKPYDSTENAGLVLIIHTEHCWFQGQRVTQLNVDTASVVRRWNQRSNAVKKEVAK